jgi:outer membrane protein
MQFRKTLYVTTLFVLPSVAHSATSLGFGFDANYWMPSSSFNDSSASSNSAYFASLYFEHPVPVLPNLKVTTSHVDSASFIEDQLDLTFYYNLYNSNLIKASWGLGATVWDIDERYYEFTDYGAHAYGRLEGYLPVTGLSTFGEVSYAMGEKFETTRWDIGLGYTLPIPVVDLGIQLGYRSQSTDAEYVRPLQRDFQSKGIYLGLGFAL